MHRAAFAAAGLDADYLALDARDFAACWAAVRRLALQGGNVTVPWKEAALAVLDSVSPDGLRARSANTFWRLPDGGYAGTSTDGDGFRRALREDLDLEPVGLRVGVLGAGGAARAVAHALASAGAAALFLWNRTPRPAVRLTAELRESGYSGELGFLAGGGGGGLPGGIGPGPSGASAVAPARPAGVGLDLLVNATSLGMDPADPSPADASRFPGLRFAVDLAYGPRPSAFLASFARAGAAIADGRSMLLHQGALAFELWTGATPPLGAMREALNRALGEARAVER